MGKDKEPMVQRTLKIPLALWEAAKAKAADQARTPLSVVIRRLLERWLKGEIDLG